MELGDSAHASASKMTALDTPAPSRSRHGVSLEPATQGVALLEERETQSPKKAGAACEVEKDLIATLISQGRELHAKQQAKWQTNERQIEAQAETIGVKSHRKPSVSQLGVQRLLSPQGPAGTIYELGEDTVASSRAGESQGQVDDSGKVKAAFLHGYNMAKIGLKGKGPANESDKEQEIQQLRARVSELEASKAQALQAAEDLVNKAKQEQRAVDEGEDEEKKQAAEEKVNEAKAALTEVEKEAPEVETPKEEELPCAQKSSGCSVEEYVEFASTALPHCASLFSAMGGGKDGEAKNLLRCPRVPYDNLLKATYDGTIFGKYISAPLQCVKGVCNQTGTVTKLALN